MSSNDLELKILRDEIIELEEFQQYEILKILDKNNVKYTQNKNGLFLNMKILDTICLENINEYLIFIKNNKN
jgi:hypothetical protein|tara:strand:+ start:1293 stop:1508 length:216 start_codon:yes stop_codon:yes gene_type:complete